MKHLGDITKISGYEVPIVDCVIGGSPCQDLSMAGKRKGLEGDRSGLFMEQMRIIKELRDADRRKRNLGCSNVNVRPRFGVWENVPGALSSNKGEDFRVVLEEFCKVAGGVKFQFLDLTMGNGPLPDASLENTSQWLGGYLMPNGGVYLKGEEELLSSQTSTEHKLLFYYLIGVNVTEKPNEIQKSYLSEILEKNPDVKYSLSAKACQGIINRAGRRGKKLPMMLQKALEQVIRHTQCKLDADVKGGAKEL